MRGWSPILSTHTSGTPKFEASVVSSRSTVSSLGSNATIDESVQSQSGERRETLLFLYALRGLFHGQIMPGCSRDAIVAKTTFAMLRAYFRSVSYEFL